jgi:sulfite exporter TauE/SafE
VTALLLTILAASLLGNLHCAGMCGAFVAIALRLHEPGAEKRRTRLLAAYNLGRLITYVALGFFVGMLGSMLDAAGTIAGFGRAAALFAGLFMILFGAATLARLAGWKTKVAPPAFLQRLLGSAMTYASKWPSPLYALAIGILTTLIPCGWLYAFVTVAGGTGSAWTGALVMAVFWIGTLPVLLSIGMALHKFGGAFARKLPVVTALVIVIMGAYTLATRWNVSAVASARSITGASLVDQVKTAAEEKPACCKPGGGTE